MEPTTLDAIKKAVQEAFSAEGGDKRFIDLSRVPLICQSITQIDKRLEKIESNLGKGVWIILGAVLLGLMSILLK